MRCPHLTAQVSMQALGRASHAHPACPPFTPLGSLQAPPIHDMAKLHGAVQMHIGDGDM